MNRGDAETRRRILIAAGVAFAHAARGFAGSSQTTPQATTLVDDLVIANHVLATEGVLDAMGHISVRHAARPKP